MFHSLHTQSLTEVPLRRSHFLYALLAGTVSAAAPAFAADMDVPPDMRPSTFEVYMGAFGGASDVGGNYADTDEFIFGNLDGVSYGFGLRGGVDYVAGGWVLGAVADWTFGGEAAEDRFNGATLDMPNLGTVRARAGYTLGDTLFYVTGGYAQAELEFSMDNELDAIAGSDTGWTSGWTLGGGVDVALSEAVSLGVEYLYVDLEDMQYEIDDLTTFNHEVDGIHSIRFGVNYAFSI
jgi:outer membrane immunogenic protein